MHVDWRFRSKRTQSDHPTDPSTLLLDQLLHPPKPPLAPPLRPKPGHNKEDVGRALVGSEGAMRQNCLNASEPRRISIIELCYLALRERYSAADAKVGVDDLAVV